ncbi:MAG: hypothetical protein LLG04_18275 [Parachlamydia sp.]|nr:hypothetical protein [Parachlamydia sp.]
MNNIYAWIPEGITHVDLHTLQQLGLLDLGRKSTKESALTRYFHVIESNEKITLVNEQFIIWIVPEKVHKSAVTYTFIALNHPQQPHLEVAFSSSGIYNSSRLVLRVLEKYLQDIEDTESTIQKFTKAS